MSDEMIVALAANGGVIQINFGSGFLTAAANDYGVARRAAGMQYAAAHPELSELDMYRLYPAIYAEEHGPLPYAVWLRARVASSGFRTTKCSNWPAWAPVS